MYFNFFYLNTTNNIQTKAIEKNFTSSARKKKHLNAHAFVSLLQQLIGTTSCKKLTVLLMAVIQSLKAKKRLSIRHMLTPSVNSVFGKTANEVLNFKY